ncbi:Disease resistance rpp13-like protein [Thalictrum thalictroides]|uniref:Disease resistance rpp13-like protein n=1 Tax=Thalictrum thalictroides TaxID=46969 RepID=A0A7J6X186_THATH|nr:Disease resistance rpp13-like protein [Thalictrum thalictroides]
MLDQLQLAIEKTKQQQQALELDGSSNSQRQLLDDEQFEKIKKELRDAKEVFPRVKNWENFVTDEFDSIEQDLEDILDDCQDFDEAKFQSILMKVEKITKVNEEIQLQSINSDNPDLPKTRQSMSNAEKASTDWQQLRIEESILESSVMANLQVSYDILKRQLKLCLLCFSIFPENSEIKKKPVIYWWIGEGLVAHTRGKTAEEVGEGIFQELAEKGMIKPVYKNKSPMVTSYVMHPWIRLMVVSVARKAEFFDFDNAGKPMNVCPKSRRACLVLPTDQRIQQGGASSSKQEERPPNEQVIITLFNVNKKYLHVSNLGWLRFSKQKKLVVFQLGRWQNSDSHHIEVDDAEFLKGLEEHTQLKYLSLCGISRITKLQDSISKLTNLKILDLRACHNLEELPSTIKAMKKLTHLDVSECYLLEHMPKGLGSLSNLEVLKGFVIGNSTSKDPCQLKELAELKKLRKLNINVGNDAVVAEEDLSQLERFETLRVLTIRWGGVVHSTPKERTRLRRAATLTMESLSMPKNLEKLDLQCFPHNVSPNWLKSSNLKNLKRLYIKGGKLGSLKNEAGDEAWNVKILRLKFLIDMVMNWSDMQSTFPHMVYLEKIKCDKLEFPCDKNGVWPDETR